MSEPREQRLRDPHVSMQIALDSLQARLRTAMVGFVESVDLDAGTCTVQPAIQGVVTKADGTEQPVDLPLLVDVPIVWMHGGPFTLTLPLAQGDEVLVVFGDRCIDGWWQQGSVAAPAEARMHDLSDAIAIPGPFSQRTKLAGVSSSSAQLRNAEGDVFVEITDEGKVRLVATTAIEAVAPEIKLTADTKVTIEAPLTEINSPSIMLDGIEWQTHRHIEPDGFTEGPVPGA